MNKYNSLSNYLNNSVHDKSLDYNQIDEGISDLLKKGWNKLFSNSKGSDEKKTGFLGMLGQLIGNFKGVSGSEDPLMKKYQEIADKEMADEEARLRQELDAERNMEIEKLEAQYQANKQQMDLKSQRKVEAYQAKTKQLKDLSAKIKNSKTNGTALLYTAEQNAQLLKQIQQTGMDLDLDDTSPALRMQELATLILCKPDGSIRSREEITAAAAENSELQQLINEYNEFARDNSKTLIDAMDNDAYKKMVKQQFGEVRTAEQAKDDLKNISEKLKEYETNANAVKTIENAQKDYENAESEVTVADKAVKKIKTNTFVKFNGDSVESLDAKDLEKAILTLAKNTDETGKPIYVTDDRFDFEKFKSDLESKGISPGITSALDPETNYFKPSPESIERALQAMDDEKLAECAKQISDNIKTTLDNANSTLTTAKEKLNNTPDPSTKEGKKKIAEGADEELKNALTRYNNIPEEDRKNKLYDTESPEGKKLYGELKKIKADAEKVEKQSKINQAANKRRYDDVVVARQNRKDLELDSDLRDMVEEMSSGIEAGEIREDGKVGFMKDGKFVPKPGPMASENDKKQYIEDRDAHIINTDPAYIDSLGVKSVKRNEDGTYKIEYGDGTVDEKASIEDAAIAKSNQISINKSKALIIKRKQDLAKTLTDCIVDDPETGGKKLDEEKFKSLSKKDKAALGLMINGDRPIKDYFTHIDFGDDDISNDYGDTSTALDELFGKDLKNQLADDWEDIENRNGDSDYEDYDDEADKNDNEDYDDNAEYDSDEEDTENGKDEAGNDLVKGEDDKWYKKKEDGSADTESGEQTNVAKRKLKNPAKTWHKRKNKRTGKTTKNYYNSKGESLSSNEYKQRIENYKKAKKRAQEKGQKVESIIYTNLTNYLFEKLK
jgi:hypothetical protein